jgi:hypothetical protein
MKKIRIISVVGAVVIILLLNISITGQEGRVEDLYVTVNPELAMASNTDDEPPLIKCRLREEQFDCACYGGTIGCISMSCPPAAVYCD